MSKITIEQKLELYRSMLLIRRTEEKLYYLFSTREMPGTMHQYIGQEAVATGVCSALTNSDYVTSTHRGHGHCIAKGADLNALMAEMFAKETGSCKGMGGSMHIADFKVGMLGANGIVGGGMPIATGAGITCKLDKKGAVVVSFFGDGAANEGAFHESLNLASVWNLPVLFVCENNEYGFSTHYRRVTNVEHIADRAGAYGIKGVIADGMDVLDVYSKASELIENMRKGGAPAILECKTYRYMGHARFEKPVYRTKEEVEEWKKRDAIERLRNEMIEEKKGVAKLIEEIDRNVDADIEAAVEFAEKSPSPKPEAYREYIYG
jgi:TPP-dependent pyruvate/acetoin dehydrogenase alpha subunit